jgi:hypothetical protein
VKSSLEISKARWNINLFAVSRCILRIFICILCQKDVSQTAMQGGNAAYAEEVKQEHGRNWDRMSHGVWQKSMVSIRNENSMRNKSGRFERSQMCLWLLLFLEDSFLVGI